MYWSKSRWYMRVPRQQCDNRKPGIPRPRHILCLFADCLGVVYSTTSSVKCKMRLNTQQHVNRFLYRCRKNVLFSTFSNKINVRIFFAVTLRFDGFLCVKRFQQANTISYDNCWKIGIFILKTSYFSFAALKFWKCTY